MIGVLINTAAVLAGGLLGLLFRKALPERWSGNILKVLGLSTAVIGIQEALNGAPILLVILSLVLGTLLGTALKLQSRVEALGKWVEKRGSADGSTLAKGFVTASLLFCVGAMAVTGPLQSALQGDHSVLIVKAILDGISAMMFASALGRGVLLSALPVFVLEGAVALGAGLMQPVLTDGAVATLVCVGSVMILAIGLNLTGISSFPVADFVPALLFAPLLWWLFSLPVFGGIFT